MATSLVDRARLGGLTRAALYDGLTVTAKARATFRASFLSGHSCRVCPEVVIPAGLPLHERRRRADVLHQIHYVRVRMARGKKKATLVNETPRMAQEARRVRDEPSAA